MGQSIKRLPGWEFALAACIESARNRTFRWGVFDCGLFVCECVDAITGVDMGEQFRGYSTLLGAWRSIKGDMESTAVSVARAYGLREIPPMRASRGDVIYLNPGELAIVGLDPKVAIGATSKGLAVIPRSRWVRAWRVE